MATSRQTAANRRNARKSTGPRSVEGKLRSSLNARRHCLNVKPRVEEEVVEMFRAILEDPSAVPSGQPLEEGSNAAIELAIAEVQVRRVALLIGAADAKAMGTLHGDATRKDRVVDLGKASATDQALKDAVLLRRYRREAEARRRKALKAWLEEFSMETVGGAFMTARRRRLSSKD